MVNSAILLQLSFLRRVSVAMICCTVVVVQQNLRNGGQMARICLLLPVLVLAVMLPQQS